MKKIKAVRRLPWTNSTLKKAKKVGEELCKY